MVKSILLASTIKPNTNTMQEHRLVKHQPLQVNPFRLMLAIIHVMLIVCNLRSITMNSNTRFSNVYTEENFFATLYNLLLLVCIATLTTSIAPNSKIISD